jgi:hypothetical protein
VTEADFQTCDAAADDVSESAAVVTRGDPPVSSEVAVTGSDGVAAAVGAKAIAFSFAAAAGISRVRGVIQVGGTVNRASRNNGDSAGNNGDSASSRSVLLDPSDTPFPNNADAGISQEVLMARFAAFLQEEVHHLTSAVFDGAPVVDGGRVAWGQLGADDGESSSRAAAVTPEKKSK